MKSLSISTATAALVALSCVSPAFAQNYAGATSTTIGGSFTNKPGAGSMLGGVSGGSLGYGSTSGPGQSSTAPSGNFVPPSRSGTGQSATISGGSFTNDSSTSNLSSRTTSRGVRRPEPGRR